MEETYKQLFIGGDLSGIQNFLYNISSKKAAVSLKGRSFYLQQYMENTCDAIEKAVKEAGAKATDIIYCSGGKFYMLTENSESIQQSIADTTLQLRESLWKEHLGQLGLNVSFIPFSENPDKSVNVVGMTNQRIGVLWQIVNQGFARQKQQKFKDILIDSYHDFFEPIPVGGNIHVCAITGIESEDCVKISDDKESDMYVLPSVKQQILLGEELRNQQHFKTFENYAKNSKLGVLRMDLDNLGKRFITGFDSIEQYKAFSKRLVDFFEKELTKIQQEPTFRNYLNIIYAGGDDLFVVGRWDKTIDFAEHVSKVFKSIFSDENISLSGGVAVVYPKYPIAKAAEMAGNAEDEAKRYRNGEKNAFCFLGKVVSWNKEFDYVKSYQQQFVSLISTYGLSKGVLHKLMLYSSIADHNKLRKKEGKTEDFSYIWHISYYLTRYINRYKDNKAVCAFCRQLRDHDIDYHNGRQLELIALAARWAELILKDELNN